MLSYRHGFHAGNVADVLKHGVLAFVLRHATAKPKPLYVLDTHAGAGSYDLGSAMAAKTGEWRQGIGRLLGLPPPWPALLEDYRALVQAGAAAGTDGLPLYPGSPAIARSLLRPIDRLELAELHGTDHGALATALGPAPRVRVTREDGPALLVARMPPPERRAIILIDPSYEIKGEAMTVVRAIARAHRRLPTGTFILWYPVVERAEAEALAAAMVATGIRRQLRIELGHLPDAPGRGMTASGLIVINPPWTLEAAAQDALPWLDRQVGAKGGSFVRMLVPE